MSILAQVLASTFVGTVLLGAVVVIVSIVRYEIGLSRALR